MGVWLIFVTLNTTVVDLPNSPEIKECNIHAVIAGRIVREKQLNTSYDIVIKQIEDMYPKHKVLYTSIANWVYSNEVASPLAVARMVLSTCVRFIEKLNSSFQES